MSVEVSDEELKQLLRSPKPAFAAQGITVDADRGLTFDVVYNGQGAWAIQRPAKTELLTGGRTVLVQPRTVEVIDIPVAVNNDVKSALDPARMAYLDEAVLEVHGRTVVGDRSCYLVRAQGLKRDGDAVYELAVDAETGVVLRVARDGQVLLEVEQFRLAVSPMPDRDGGEAVSDGESRV